MSGVLGDFGLVLRAERGRELHLQRAAGGRPHGACGQFDQNGDGARRAPATGSRTGRVIDLTTRTTGTGGRELGVLEQLFGNLLNLDAEQFQDQ